MRLDFDRGSMMSEYEQRALVCSLVGHEFKPWSIRVEGILHTRVLCVRCGRTQLPISDGSRAVRITAQKEAALR